MDLASTLNPHASKVLSGLRIVSGLMFMQHGTQKIFGFPAEAMGPFDIMSQMGIGGVLELVGGALIVLGLFTRPVAILMSGMMAVAYFQFHAPAASSRWSTRVSLRPSTAGSSSTSASPARASGPSMRR